MATINFLLIMIVYVIACLGMGSILIFLLSRTKTKLAPSASAEFATRFLLGQGLLGNFWVFIALAGNFSPLVVKGVIAPLFILGILLNQKLFIDVVKQLLVIRREFNFETMGWKSFIIITLLLWAAWANYIGRPLESSASRFYMALPKVISASEHLKVLPGYEEVASLGLQGEMQFAALMTLGSPESTQAFSWLTLTAGCILLLALGRQVGLNRRGQWIIIAMVFTSSAVILLSGSGKTDVYAAAFAFAAYFWAINIENEDRIQASILTGLFGGLAVVAKVSYVGSFLPSLAVILLWKIFLQPQDKKLSYQILSFALIGISAVFIAIQLPIKNQLLFNNPLAPYGMKDIFDQVWYGTDTIQKIYLTLPFALTFGAYWGQGGGLTPLVLMFLPLLFLLPRSRRILENPLIVISIASVFGLVCWFVSHPSVFAPRYFLGCLLLLLLPSAKAASDYSLRGNGNSNLILIITIPFLLSTSLSYTTFLFIPESNLNSLFNGEPNCRNEPMRCKISNDINTVLESGERVFTNTRYRYWLRADLIQCAATTSEIENYLTLETSDLRWNYLVGRGFQTVFIENRSTPIPNTIRNDLREIPEWLSISFRESSEGLLYFSLLPKDSEHTILFECNQDPFPAWNIVEVFSP